MNEAWIDRVVLNRGRGVLNGMFTVERRSVVCLSAMVGWTPPEKGNLLLVITGERLTEAKAAEIGFIKTSSGFYRYLAPSIKDGKLAFDFEVIPEVTGFQIRPWNMTTPVVLEDIVLTSEDAVPVFPGPSRRVMKRWHPLTADGSRSLSANFLIRKTNCGFHCVAHCNRWFESMDEFAVRARSDAFGRDDVYVETHTGELVPASLQRAQPAILEIPASLDAYLKSIGDKSRNMIRKARKLGYAFRRVGPETLGQDIYEIRTSDPMRQGRPIPEYFHTNPPQYVVAPSPVGCALHTEKFIGIFLGDRLVSYITVFLFGELAQVNHILCHKAHATNGVMNLNVLHMVDELIAHHPHVKAVNYMYIAGQDSGIDTFRRSVGFAPRSFLTYDGAPAMFDSPAKSVSENADDVLSARHESKGKEKLRLSQWAFIRESIAAEGALAHVADRIGRAVVEMPQPVPEQFVEYIGKGLMRSVAVQPAGTIIAVPFPGRADADTGHGVADYLKRRFKGSPVGNDGFQSGFKGGELRALAFFEIADWAEQFCNGILVLEKVTQAPGTASETDETPDVRVMAEADFLAATAVRPSRLERVRLVDDYQPLAADWLTAGTAQMSFMTGATRIDVKVGTRFPWNHTFALNADRMWYYSLAYVGRLLATWAQRKDADARKLAIELISSFMDFTAIAENRLAIGRIPSADHSASERLKVLLTCHQVLEEVGASTRLRVRLLREIHRWAEWLADDRNLGVGNHKLMGATSLIYVCALLADGEGRGYLEIATDRILSLAAQSFDKDGLCNENTIGYHNFNLSLYRKLRAILANLQIAGDLRDGIDALIGTASNALELCVLPDGKIPPIGDSPRYDLGLQSRDGAFCFSESGFAVVKRDGLYFSLVCGGRTEWHKQMDDSSIYLQYNGVDVVVDAGSYSYDQGDPYSRCITSTTGHSAIVPAALDGLPRHEVQSKFGPVSGRIEQFEESDDGVRIACAYTVPGYDATLNRYVFVGRSDEVVVVDTFDAPDTADVVQRFLLGPEIDVESDDECIHLSAQKFAGTLIHRGANADIYRGQGDDKIRGWTAFEFGKVVPTTGVDLRSRGGDMAYATIIRLGEGGLTDCSPAAMNFAARTDPFFETGTARLHDDN
ncbi:MULTISPECIES: heparinase II/III domain-containing protein [unclassified Burkholderia]|uniref:heparinase II/III domain-containing protein n=1 Tax=unclassified Burkholderia TaxID=2613784 RepID=UPI002AB2D75F|nr:MULTISPECIES: heparinase II/III family protein [unclassified Burkholderia]